MHMRASAWLKIGILVVGVGAAVLVPASIHRGRYYRSLNQFYTLLTVGRACLLYQRECGGAPTDVADLLRTGCLRRSANGEWVDTRRGTNGWRTAYEDALRVRLLVPATSASCEWQGGLLIDKATAAPFALVDMDDAAVWREHVDLANKHLAQDWLKMINGEPIPDW
jgi:hypothetical protein